MEPDYLFYLELSKHWTLVHNVAEIMLVIFALQGGSRGTVAPLKLKIYVESPCKML